MIKILLVFFGSPNDPDPKIQSKTISEIVRDNFNLTTCFISKTPKIKERFVVAGQACEDLVFECERFEGNRVESKVEGHEYVIFASFVSRLGAIKDEQEINSILEFRAEHRTPVKQT
jgi:hypothetical protein